VKINTKIIIVQNTQNKLFKTKEKYKYNIFVKMKIDYFN